MINILDILLIVLFFQLLTLVPFLIGSKGNRILSNRLLGFLLFSKALCILDFLATKHVDFMLDHIPHLLFIGSSFRILWGPLLLMYVQSITNPEFKFSKKQLLHFIPFSIHALWLTFSFHILSAEAKYTIIENNELFNSGLWKVYPYLFYGYLFIYSFLCLLSIRKYHQLIRENYSDISSINLNWLSFIVSGFIFKIGFDVWYIFSDKQTIGAMVAIYSSRIILFSLLNVMIFKCLKHPFLLLGEKHIPQEKKKSLSKPLQDRYAEKVLTYTKSHKPYLNPELTLEELSKMVDIPPRSLSEVLNESLNCNFYDFINKHRIEESERIFSEYKANNKTILEVLYEVGFNSKSAFNTAFKKYNGMTPSEFRKFVAASSN